MKNTITKISLNDFINKNYSDKELLTDIKTYINNSYIFYENNIYNLDSKLKYEDINGYFIYNDFKIKIEIAIEIAKNGNISSKFVNKYYRNKKNLQKVLQHIPGVSFNKNTRLYTVRINHDGNKINLGKFEDIVDACRVRIFAETKYHKKVISHLTPEMKKILQLPENFEGVYGG